MFQPLIFRQIEVAARTITLVGSVIVSTCTGHNNNVVLRCELLKPVENKQVS